MGNGKTGCGNNAERIYYCNNYALLLRVGKEDRKHMRKVKQIWLTSYINFKKWKRNPQVIMSFCLCFTVCFLLSDKVVKFAEEQDTVIQFLEPFIWTFGDADSILLVSMPLVLLLSGIPNLNNDVPFFLVRINRRIWLMGQILYSMLTTFVYVLFTLISTCVIAGYKGYYANMWSDTAAILGYSKIGKKIAVPALLKVLELSYPYESTIQIFGLMLGYSLLLSGIVLVMNLCKNNSGIIGGIVYSGLGVVINAERISKWFNLPLLKRNIANIICSWISPLNHATYYMHNFGYDNFPRLWVSYLLFAILSCILFALSMLRIRRYQFSFTGTQK